MWKIGIISFIRITQSKVRPIENLSFLMISAIFEMLLLWTAWSELSLWYQFSTQNLMPSKFHLMGLAKFRQLAILAVSGGYFSWLLWRMGLPDFGFHIFELPRTWAFQNGIPLASWVFFLKWLRRHMWQSKNQLKNVPLVLSKGHDQVEILIFNQKFVHP